MYTRQSIVTEQFYIGEALVRVKYSIEPREMDVGLSGGVVIEDLFHLKGDTKLSHEGLMEAAERLISEDLCCE